MAQTERAEEITTIPPNWEKQVKEIFQVYDKKANNEIVFKDLPDAVRSCGVRLLNQHIIEIQNEFKLNENSKISYEEFKNITKRATDLEIKDAQIAKSFELFVDEKGFIQLDKFKHALMTLGDDRLSKEDIIILLRDAGFDEKTDHAIHYSKVLELVQGNVL
ncbi:Centrin-1 [Reticulomyxa filosa]|uniref:Calmodulin n=1 Tax=Reticulomyxa filosa TaxID=46433 RepID=X6P5U3_RETFI|nr:Centrin-1 [Reticulomyxa filosa]|eukprot:ETO32982.1 Centrin-1 [Reticulomyxa filosa]